MTKEELKQEAEESADKWIKWAIDHKSLTYWNSFVEGYLASAEPREKRIEELETRCTELFLQNNQFAEQIEKLTQKVTLESLDVVSGKIAELEQENAELETRIERAKECMKKLLFIIKSDPANYNCKGLVQDAEDFIRNRTCHIRQLGQHCISKTRCIMCDKQVKEK